MKVVRWFKCPVVGTGRVTEEKDDSYRPAIADLPLEHRGWSAVYYPSRPPYKFCVVRMEIKHGIPIPNVEELDVEGMRRLCDESPHFRHRWLDQPIYSAQSPQPEILGDPVETRYFRKDTHTVNTVTLRKLLTSRSGASEYYQWSYDADPYVITKGRYDFYVYKRAVGGASTTIGSAIALTTRTANGEGMQSATWSCPATELVATDAIEVGIRLSCEYDSYPASSAKRTFITEQLGAQQLNATTWTIYRYSYLAGYDTYSGTARVYYDTATYDTRITNFSWTAPPPVEPPTVTTQDATNIGLD